VWYLAGRSQALARGAVQRLVLDGLPWALFRTAGGAACLIQDRCAHRGMPLSAGRVCGEQIECPYHGWRYDGAGQLAAVPAFEPRPDCALPRLQVRESQGFIWATAAANPPQPPQFAHWEEPGWTCWVMQSYFKASVEACLENFLDCPHATFVHRYWFRAPTARPVRAIVRSLPDGAEAEYFEEPRERSLVWTLLAPRQGTMQHTDRFIAPATSRVDYIFPSGLAYVITSHCTPIDNSTTAVTTVIGFKSRWGRLVKLFFKPLARRILQQDIDMLALQAKNRDWPNPPPLLSTPADLLGPSIWHWRRALAAGQIPTPHETRLVTLFL
jgi:phenylpropionate dioxygenase-like ring-hydroxylating dioxygenase large terminal subunit